MVSWPAALVAIYLAARFRSLREILPSSSTYVHLLQRDPHIQDPSATPNGPSLASSPASRPITGAILRYRSLAPFSNASLASASAPCATSRFAWKPSNAYAERRRWHPPSWRSSPSSRPADRSMRCDISPRRSTGIACATPSNSRKVRAWRISQVRKTVGLQEIHNLLDVCRHSFHSPYRRSRIGERQVNHRRRQFGLVSENATDESPHVHFPLPSVITISICQ